jgi:hypothetical protein
MNENTQAGSRGILGNRGDSLYGTWTGPVALPRMLIRQAAIGQGGRPCERCSRHIG